jgi:predicted oxidoreductase
LQDGVLDQVMRDGFAALAWSPLAGGRLGDEQTRDAGAVRVREAIARLAKRHRAAPSAIALAFLLACPAEITPILGTKSKERLAAALAARECALSRAEWYRLLEAARGEKMP